MSEEWRAPGETPTILLVDDRKQNLLALEALLEPLGYELIAASSGEEALRHLLTSEIAVILLDVRMPGMDGFETAARIKERERTADIPILFLTAEPADVQQVVRAFSSGAVDFLSKPVDEWLLRAKVQVFVELAQKTRLLRRESELLAKRLDDQYATEARRLRRLADAAVVINSTQSLPEMLHVINESAREVIGAHEAETVITAVASAAPPELSRSYSAKYQAWAAEGRSADMAPIYSMVLGENQPVRMTKEQIATSLSARGLFGIAPGHPFLEGWLAVPVIGRSGEALGIIQVADKVDADFTEGDEVVLVQLAQLAAVAIENARRFEQEHRIAQVLQRSLLPQTLPRIAGLELAAHYEAGGGGTQVGGDWYDVFTVPEGRVALVLGDVAGHGARAAAVMGQLRTALRAYALRGAPPADVIAQLDAFLQDTDSGDLATVVIVLLDVGTGALEVVRAGHLPPLVAPPGEPGAYVESDPDPPLGVVAAARYSTVRTTLEPGAILVLYSDGLVETRSESLEDGLSRLAGALTGDVADLNATCAAIVADVAQQDREDDVTILLARLTRPAAG